ncbi:hypothetical protein ABIA38_007203 [Embleya sp. AB8]
MPTTGTAPFGRTHQGTLRIKAPYVSKHLTYQGTSGCLEFADQLAVHPAQSIDQPLQPLSGAITLSGEWITSTTSPISDSL